MKTIFFSICFIVFLFQSITTQSLSIQLDITLKNNDQREQQTKEQLQRLLSTFDISKFIFTKKIAIESGFVIPHSHPVLTLSTRHLKDDELLLATFIHEQFHWYLDGKDKQIEDAVKDLKNIFPKVPVGHPEGADSEGSTYVHLLICAMEYKAMKQLLGELRARQVFDFWTTDHYTWIYKTVLEKEREITLLMRKHNLK